MKISFSYLLHVVEIGNLSLIELHVCLCAICEIVCWPGVRLPLGVAECLNLARVYASSGRGHKISHLAFWSKWCGMTLFLFPNEV